MKKIKLFDYQQEMLNKIIQTLTTETLDGVSYNEKGKKVKVGNSVMVQMPTGTGKTSTDQQIINLLKGRGSDGDYAKAIAECYCALGIKAVALDSKTPAKTRQRMVEAFRHGNLDCLVNVNLFDEGFDCPDVEYIQMARPTLSLAKYLQMVGRGLRINKEDPDKVCMIIDNVGNYRKFGYPDKPRNWAAMYAGLTAGKGTVPPYVKKMGNLIVVEEDMVMVRKASPQRKKMTGAQLEKYKKSIEPFISEDGRLMGLRTPDEVVMKPKYRYISKFRGDYAIFCLNTFGWQRGVIDKLGYVVIPAEYDEIKFLDAHTVKCWLPKGGTMKMTI